LDGKTQLFSHETCENEKLKKRAIIIHGPTENKNGTGENSFSPLPFFRISGKHVVRKVSIIPQLGPGSMTLVFPDALHPLGGKCRPARGSRQRFPK